MDGIGADDDAHDSGYLKSHLDTLWGRGFARGRVTPILGAGASLFGRPPTGSRWARAGSFDADGLAWDGAPSSQELAHYLMDCFRIDPDSIRSPDLLNVAQWVATMAPGQDELYSELHDVFDRDFPSTPLHEFLAELPSRLRPAVATGRTGPDETMPGMLIATTNYDDLLERAFRARGEEFDLVVYMAAGPHSGQFCHYHPDGAMTPIEDAQNYDDANPDVRSVILKLHGMVDRQADHMAEEPGRAVGRTDSQDSFVITEDDYIQYLAQTNLQTLLPAHILSRLKSSHLLFLGYSLGDWNLRSIMYQLRKEENKPTTWWSIQRGSSEVERRCWQNSARRVEIFEMDLEEYLIKVRDSLDSWLAEDAPA